MKRKALSIMLVSAMAVSLLAGCGSSAAATTESAPAEEKTEAAAETATEEAAPAGENTLSVYAWDANFNIPALKAAEKDYQENVDPSFTLNIIEQSQSSDVENAITLAATSGDYSNLPDIVLFQDHYIQRYVADYPDAWVDATDAEGMDWSNVGAEKASYSTIDGKHYGFPVDNGTAVMAYRVDLLEECGYSIDDLTGCTWAKFIEIGEDVYAKTGKYLLSMDGSGNDLIYMMLQAEGESQFKDGKLNILENEKAMRVIATIVEMAQKNVLYLANSWGDYTDQSIIGDMVAGVCNGNWIIPTIKQVSENSGKWEITSMPTLDGGEGFAANGGSSLYITAACQNTDLAKKFLAYTFGGSTVTYDAALRDGGVVACCATAGASDVYQEGVEYFNGQAIYAKIVEMGANVPVIEQNDFHYTVRENLGAAIINAVNGADLQTEVEAACQQINFAMGN